MRFVMIMAVVLWLAYSCGDNNSNTNGSGNDTVGLTNPTSIDTIKHPTGVDNSSAISTDTAAMSVENSINKADSAAKKPNR